MTDDQAEFDRRMRADSVAPMREPQAQKIKATSSHGHAVELVKPEELVSEEALGELFDKWQEDWPLPWGENMRAAVINFGRAVLGELKIGVIYPYEAGPVYCGHEKKHPKDHCSHLGDLGCARLCLAACSFRFGAVLVRKPRTTDEAPRWKPPEKVLDTPSP